ncbi:MAG: lipase family protein [Segetibacter sp.]
MFNQSDAPSNFPKTFSGFEIGAAAGFVTLIPDFIGYGVSQNIPHPYYIENYSAQAVVDMIKAAKQFLTNQKIPISNRTFLLGYSEGGYVTMAAQKEIETNKQNKLSLTAVGAGAGGYDISGMLKGIASSTTYAAPSFLALFVKGYNSTYSWNRPYSDFFQEPYASRIPSLLDGTKSRSQIDSALTTSTAALFNPVFRANLSNPKEEIILKHAIASNSLLNWAPKTPTRLFYGTSDEAVFYETSVTTYNNLKAAGSTNLELISIPGGTHQTSLKPMILNVLPWFKSLDQ